MRAMMSRTRLDVYRGGCRVCDWVGSRCAISVPVPLMAMATVSGSAVTAMAVTAMAVSAMAPAAVVRVRHIQVLSLRRRNYSGIPICWARCVGMPNRRCPPQRRPIVIATTVTVVRVRRR